MVKCTSIWFRNVRQYAKFGTHMYNMCNIYIKGIIIQGFICSSYVLDASVCV